VVEAWAVMVAVVVVVVVVVLVVIGISYTVLSFLPFDQYVPGLQFEWFREIG